MRENRGASSSEQYIKKSNRKMFLFGVLLFIAFIFAWLVFSDKKQEIEDQTPASSKLDDIGSISDIDEDIEPISRSDAKLIVEPAEVNIENVVIGSEVEAIITLTSAKNTRSGDSVIFLGASFSQEQDDGFILETTCAEGEPLEAGESCIIKVLWRPAAARVLQNLLNIRWRENSYSSFTDRVTNVLVKGQSTDSKCCVTCEDSKNVNNQEEAGGLNGNLYDVENDTIVVDGETLTRVGDIWINKNKEIVAIAEPNKIALNLKSEFIGKVSKKREVVTDSGEKVGRLLDDDTLVDVDLNVLGGAIAVTSVMDMNGTIIGKVVNDGSVVNSEGTVIGKPMVDGTVLSLEGKELGVISPWGLIADFNGKVIGGILPDASIRNADNDIVGHVLPNGLALSEEGALIGGTIPQGVGVGSSCQTIGQVHMNGAVKDAFGQTVGKVLIDGTVIDPEGNDLGAVVNKGIVINDKGSIIGFVNSEGKAVGAKGSLIGCINPDGSIFAGKRSIGAVLSKGRVIGYMRQVMGSAYPNGMVYNIKGEEVGRVMPDKYVKDSDDKIIGSVIERSAAVADGCRLLGLVSLTGQVIDLEGNLTGYVTPEKEVVNEQGEKIGVVITKGTVVDLKGKVIGRLRLDGKVIDFSGEVIGCINADGTVTSLDGTVIGSLINSGGAVPVQSGVVLDANGNPTGWSIIGNKVYDANGNEIGTIDSDGVIVSPDGKFLGIIPPDGVVVSDDGLILGRYSSKTGYAVNQSGERFGKVLADFSVISGDGLEVLGSLIPDKTNFMKQDGSYLGQMRLDGTLRDKSDNLVGAIHANGMVTDKDGTIVGLRIPQGRVFSLKGEQIGSVNALGEVISPAKSVIGTITANGIAISSNGKVLGGIQNRLSLAFDANGFLGYPHQDGSISDKDGTIIGKMTPFGLVVQDGVVIGRMLRLGIYFNPERKVIGWASFDGDLVSIDGSKIGKLFADGTAFDKTSHFIGYLAQKGTVLNTNGKLVSYMSVSNRLLDGKNTLLGSVSASQTVYNDIDEAIGKIAQPGLAVDNDGKVLGWLRSDGTIGDKTKTLGFLWFDHTVVNNKGDIIGSYIPFNAVAYNDNMQGVGFVGDTGEIISPLGQSRGVVGASHVVMDKGVVVAQLTDNMSFATDILAPKMVGVVQTNSSIRQLNGDKVIGSVMMNNYGVSMTKQVMSSVVNMGAPVSNTLTSLGRLLSSGTAILKGMPEGQISGIGAIYNQKQAISGVVLPNTTFIAKNGLVLGKTAGTAGVTNSDGKKIATHMHTGLALSSDNLWAGGRMPRGIVVDDDAKTLGVISPDGVVINKDNAIVARVLGDGAAADAVNRELYNAMPYVGSALMQGLPYSYRNVVLGRTTMNGDVVNADEAKIHRILDDGTILGKEEPLVGVVLPFYPAIAHSGNVLGVLNGSGEVLSATGEKAGKIAVNGAVKTGEYEIKGALIPSTLITNECKVVGQTAYNGQVVDVNGTVVGRIQPDKWAVSSHGAKIGRVTRIGIVMSPKGEYLGRTVPDSTVLGPNGVNIGCSRNDGTVVNQDGEVIGATLERGLVLDKNGKPMGRVKAQGQVVDANGNEIGRLTADGSVIDKNGVVIGHMVPRDQELLFDEKGNIKGTFGTDGTFYDPKTGEAVFKVSPDGKVYDMNGNLIGEIKDNDFVDLKGNKLGDMNVLIDKNGNVIGIISGCNVVNAQGEKLASISPDGTIIDLNGDRFGKILGDGTLLDKNGAILGNVRGTNPRLDKCGIKTVEASVPVYKDARMRTLYDKDGNIIGYIDEKGNMYDKDGNLIGRVDENGNVYDAEGNLIGHMDAQGIIYDLDGNITGSASPEDDGRRLLYDENGNLIGWVKDGILYDANGNVIGYVDAEGNVYDNNGKKIGQIGKDGVYRDPNGNAMGHVSEKRSTSWSTAGRGIYIGNKVYGLTENGSIVNDEGIVIGYMGEDGKPYTLDNRQLTASGDSRGRVRPNVNKTLTATPEQVQQMQQELSRRRSEMKSGIQQSATIKPSKRIQAMAREQQDKNWESLQVKKNVSSYPVDMSRMILRDKAIPAVLVHSIDSRYSTVPVTAIVERHIYSETGRNIIIPAGSRLIGEFSGEQGSSKRVAKLEITWKRLIRPDGGSFTFEASSGDAQGRGGVAAYLDDQLVEKFGKPIMASVITSAVSYMMATNDDVMNDAGTDQTTTSSRSEAANDARKNFIDAMGQIFDQLLQDATGIEPVIFVPSGTRLTVYSNEDLWLRSSEDDIEEADEEDTGSVQGIGSKSWLDQRSQKTETEETDEEYEEDEPSSQSKKQEEEDYYQPSSKTTGSSLSKQASQNSSNGTIYDGRNDSNQPAPESLSTRKAAPVLPRSGQGDRLF